ncbi:MAG: hypothetical protein QM642_10270 [Edaphocola sp.]
MLKVVVLCVSLVCFLNSSNAQRNIVISFNPLDCINCTANIDQVFKMAPTAKIVIKQEFIADSASIVEKYGLGDYRENIVWNDALYEKFGHKPTSKVGVLDGNEVMWFGDLKTMVPHELSQQIAQSDCNVKFPSNISLYSYKDFFLVEDYLNRGFMIYADGALNKISLPDTLVKHIYLSVLLDTVSFNAYVYLKKHPQFRPRIENVIPISKDSFKIIYSLLALDEVVGGHDSMFESRYFIIEASPLKIHSITNIEQSNNLQGCSFSPISGFCFNEKTYINVENIDVDKGGDYYFVGTLKNKKGNSRSENHKLEVDRLPFNLPQYLIDSKIKYGLLRLINHKSFMTYPLSNKIFDLAINKTISLPFPEAYYRKNHNFKTDYKIYFTINDFKYREETKEFRVLYYLDGAMYVLKYSPEKNKVEHKKLPIDNSDVEKASCCLSENGDKVVIKFKEKDCLEYMDL